MGDVAHTAIGFGRRNGQCVIDEGAKGSGSRAALQKLTSVAELHGGCEYDSTPLVNVRQNGLLPAQSTMPTTLKIDFVSDVSCPWCAIGLGALEQALQGLAPDITAGLHFQPFELNPHMGPGGQDITEHLSEKYGSTPEQQEQIRASIRARGAQVGFEFHPGGRGRIYNTFDCHRLLHWAALQGAAPQLALKKALLVACHGQQQAMESHEVLLAAVNAARLDTAEAAQVLRCDRYASEVRRQQAFYASHGIRSVPAVIINDQHLISGGQPAAVFEQALRQIAQTPSSAGDRPPGGLPIPPL